MSDNQHILNYKNNLRQDMISARMGILSDVAQRSADLLAGNLLRIIPENAKVAVYCAIRGEINLNVVIEKLQSRGDQIALPVIDDGSKVLRFLEVTADSELTSGKYGISCPLPHLPEIIPDVAIVPLVAFDKNGNRLGYGGGYYDATIKYLRSRNEKLLVIGVAYAMQCVGNLPVHGGDQKMDMVVTEEGIV